MRSSGNTGSEHLRRLSLSSALSSRAHSGTRGDFLLPLTGTTTQDAAGRSKDSAA